MAKLITLSAGGYTTVIDVAHGANCVSLRHDGMGACILRECAGEKDNPYLYGMPILFPANRISDGTFTFDAFPSTRRRRGVICTDFYTKRPHRSLHKKRIPFPYVFRRPTPIFRILLRLRCATPSRKAAFCRR